MRIAKVLFKDEEAGVLTQYDDASFIFRYHDHVQLGTLESNSWNNIIRNKRLINREFKDKNISVQASGSATGASSDSYLRDIDFNLITL